MEKKELKKEQVARLEYLQSECNKAFSQGSAIYKSWQIAIKNEFEIDYVPENLPQEKKTQ